MNESNIWVSIWLSTVASYRVTHILNDEFYNLKINYLSSSRCVTQF